MITRQHVAAILAKCAAHDPRFPKPSDALLEAWLEEWELFPHLTVDDGMAAVREYYSAPNQDVPLAADILVIARKYARDRYERSDLDSPERQSHEARCDELAAPDDATIVGRAKAIASFAETFGVSHAEAAVRTRPEYADRNALDATAVEVAHARQSRPAEPIPCPDCGSTDIPCPCETTLDAAAEQP
jgi:hypothetical protein